MEHDKLVEKVARIVCCGGDDKCDRRWYNQGPCDIRAEDRTSMEQARSILALVADALGEPSEEMLSAYWRELISPYDISMEADDAAERHLLAVLRASPLHPQGAKTQKPAALSS